MPFNRKLIKVLRGDLGLSQQEFADLITSYSNLNGIDIEATTRGTVCRWERGSRDLNFEVLDILYMIARDNGYEDLGLYSPPRKHKSPR